MKRCGIVFLFLLFFINANSQYKNIILDQNAETSRVVEPVIAINPRNTMNVVVASGLNTVYYTVDGGKNWEKAKVTSVYGAGGHAVVVCDNKGTFYYIHVADSAGVGNATEKSLDAIISHVSEDGGKTWDAGVPIGLNPPKNQNKPWADVNSKGEVAVAWTQYDKYRTTESDCKSVIMLSTSSNGKKWGKPLPLSNAPGGCLDDNNTVSGATPAISDDKKLFVAWATSGKIMLDRSFDNGAMWLSNDIEVAKQNGGSAVAIPGHQRVGGFPTIKIDRTKTAQKGILYLTYGEKAKDSDDTDVQFLRSSQFGDFWTSPMKIGEDKLNRPQFLPAMCIDQVTGYVYIVYYDRGEYEDNRTDVTLAYSTNNGTSFQTVRISEAPFSPDENPTLGDYISISAHKGTITPVWIRMDGDKASVVTTVIRHEELPK